MKKELQSMEEPMEMGLQSFIFQETTFLKS